MESNNNWRETIEENKTSDIIKELDEIMSANPLSPSNAEKTKSKLENLIVNNSWNDKNERLIASIGENAVSYKWLHEKNAIYYKSINVILNVVVIIFSTGLSAQTFFPDESSSALEISKRVFIYITNVLTVIVNYFKFTELSTKHTETANKFSELYHDIQQQLCMYRKDRYLATKYIQETFKKYDTIVVSSPDLTPYIVNKFKSTFKNTNLSIPNIADNIEKIEIITEDNIQTNKVDNIEMSNINMKSTKSNNLKNINKINSLIIEGDITDEDLKELKMDDINELRAKGILAKIKWEDQRYSNFS